MRKIITLCLMVAAVAAFGKNMYCDRVIHNSFFNCVGFHGPSAGELQNIKVYGDEGNGMVQIWLLDGNGSSYKEFYWWNPAAHPEVGEEDWYWGDKDGNYEEYTFPVAQGFAVVDYLNSAERTIVVRLNDPKTWALYEDYEDTP